MALPRCTSAPGGGSPELGEGLRDRLGPQRRPQGRAGGSGELLVWRGSERAGFRLTP